MKNPIARLLGRKPAPEPVPAPPPLTLTPSHSVPPKSDPAAQLPATSNRGAAQTPAQALARRLSIAAEQKIERPRKPSTAAASEPATPASEPVAATPVAAAKAPAKASEAPPQDPADSAEKVPAKPVAKPVRATVKRKAEVDLSGLQGLPGFLGGGLVDIETGVVLYSAEGQAGFDLIATSEMIAGLVRAKANAVKLMGLDDQIEDIALTLGKQYHLMRPLSGSRPVFLYAAVDREGANIGLARAQLKAAEATVKLG